MLDHRGKITGIIRHVVSLVYVCMLQTKLPHCSYVQAVMRMPCNSKEQLQVFRVTVIFKTTNDGRYWNLLRITCCSCWCIVSVHMFCRQVAGTDRNSVDEFLCVFCSYCSSIENMLLLIFIWAQQFRTMDYQPSVLWFGDSASLLNKFCLLCSIFWWMSRLLASPCKCWVSLNRW